ncbi:ABC transporter ATP-binding protein [Virgibacillus sp. YIM 98842]|jgi:ABC-2 type transport system ATP-binding protein|uniref:ATP-binding cassette domain-containing protein n=1 Tax=Virgibacillus sp. YIM 98842 TaxID=2663533 RepID=UPI0013D93761|nr:ABC transporter ATP-binding protein [Virgibacillus sp. YIM 98842]
MNIKANRLGLNFGNQRALQDVTFDLTEKKIYGLLGRNGAGKTSLLSILASFREPTAGSVTINGETPFENPKIMQQVAFLYDKDYQEESDNIIGLLQGIQPYRPYFDMEYAEYLVEKFKLDRNKPIKKFSKGMQSAANVITGLASRTPITIFDEVYLGMDAPARDIFYKELLNDQENYPRIIILSTHLVSEMDYLFDEVIILKNGEFLLQEDYDSLTSKGARITGEKQLVEAFVQSKVQLNEEQLGNTKSVMIYGKLTDTERKTALDKGLEVGPVSLHDLFIHLTEEENADEKLS